MTVVSQAAQSEVPSGQPDVGPAQAASLRETRRLHLAPDLPAARSVRPSASPGDSEESVAARLALLRDRDRQFDDETTQPVSGKTPAMRPEMPPPATKPTPERRAPVHRPPAWDYPVAVEPPIVEPSDYEWISRLEARARELERENLALRSHRDQVVAEYLAVRASTSWRVGWLATTPLRLIRRFARGLAGQLR